MTIVRPASGSDNGRLVPRDPLLSIKLCKINELQRTVDLVGGAKQTAGGWKCESKFKSLYISMLREH